MNRYKQISIWILVNLLALSAFYFGFIEGIVWSKNISVFYIWWVFIFSILYHLEGTFNHLAKIGWKLLIPVGLDFCVDVLLLACIVGAGHWFLGIIWLIHTYLAVALVGRLEEASKKKEDSLLDQLRRDQQ